MAYTSKLSARLARLFGTTGWSVVLPFVIVACNDTLAPKTVDPGDPNSPTEVASISISPASVSPQVGQTVPLAATLRDPEGQVIVSEVVEWSSDAPEVASVSSTGLVTARSTGRTRIRGRSHGKTDTATVVVVDTTTPPTPPDTTTPPPPPPPTGGAWPHEPAGWSLLSDNPFSLLSTQGWNVSWNDAGLASIVTDATAPASPSTVLEMRYPAGFAGGSGPANVWHPLPNVRRLYTGFWWKASAPWQGHASNVNKILFAFPSSGGDIYLAMYGPPGGPYALRVLPQFPGLNSAWLMPNVNNVPVTVGSWHRIEWVIDYGTGGATGVVQWWMDGVLIGDHRNVEMPTGALIEFKINPTWGGAGDTKQSNDYFRYDHIRISGN